MPSTSRRPLAARPVRRPLAALLGLVLAATSLVVIAGSADAGTNAMIRLSSGKLRVRAAPSTQGKVVGYLPNRTRLTIVCQVTGQYVVGTVRRTTRWDRLPNGRFVSHAFVSTNVDVSSCTKPTPPPKKVLPGPVGAVAKAKFIAASVGPAQRGYREYGVPASVTIAQAILESGWGRSSLTANDRNYFGIKCFGGYPGPLAVDCHTYNTWECTPRCYPTKASFRVYATIAGSFRDHGRFLTVNPRYHNAFQYSNDANAFIWEVWKAGYATSPTYYVNITNIMRKYGLYRFDRH